MKFNEMMYYYTGNIIRGRSFSSVERSAENGFREPSRSDGLVFAGDFNLLEPIERELVVSTLDIKIRSEICTLSKQHQNSSNRL